jgi:hypothetical protein
MSEFACERPRAGWDAKIAGIAVRRASKDMNIGNAVFFMKKRLRAPAMLIAGRSPQREDWSRIFNSGS